MGKEREHSLIGKIKYVIRKHSGNIVGLGLIVGGGTACACGKESATPTAIPEPTITPIAIGGEVPGPCVLPQNSTEEIIREFNKCVEAQIVAGQATATAEAQKPTATAAATAEVKKDVPCAILSPEYCSTAELVKWQDPRGRIKDFVAFHLPPGAPIFAPLPGDVATGGKSLVNPEAVVIGIINRSDSTELSVEMHGDIRPQEKIYTTQKGNLLGVIDTKGITLLGGKYNFAFSISRWDKEKKAYVTDDEMLKQLFPHLFK